MRLSLESGSVGAERLKDRAKQMMRRFIVQGSSTKVAQPRVENGSLPVISCGIFIRNWLIPIGSLEHIRERPNKNNKTFVNIVLCVCALCVLVYIVYIVYIVCVCCVCVCLFACLLA